MNRAFSLSLPVLNLRRELRLALVAAMESCWVYSILVLLAEMIRVPALSSPFALFAAYWIALIVGRDLPRRQVRWVIVQALAIVIAITVLLVIARIELYAERYWLDFGWMPRYIQALVLAEGFGRAIYLTLAVLFVFIRGLGFGSRPLTLWFVGFQFRIGVVIFFGLMLVSAIYRPLDVSPWVFSYFFLSLLSISLARLDEMGSDLHYGPRWAITLVAGVVLVLFLGLVLLQFFTLDAATWFLGLFSPLWFVVEIILLIIAIPASYLAAFLVDLLRPLFTNLSQLFQGLLRAVPENQARDNSTFDQLNAMFNSLAPVLRTVGLLIVILVIGYFLARAINRRMVKSESEAYEREALESEDETARTRRAFLPKKTPPLHRARQHGVETIRRIYAAMVARAEEAGLPRKVAETPYEFSPRLQGAWQDQSSDVSAITEAYVAVHYAEHDATDEEVDRVRTAWKRIEEAVKLSAKRTKES